MVTIQVATKMLIHYNTDNFVNGHDLFLLYICCSVHLGNICFIQIQLEVQYYLFFKSF
jgi:hypothetical protein